MLSRLCLEVNYYSVNTIFVSTLLNSALFFYLCVACISANSIGYDRQAQQTLSKTINSLIRNKKFFNLTSNIQSLTPPTNASFVSTICGNDIELNKRIGCCKPTDTRYIWNAKLENNGFTLSTPPSKVTEPLSKPQVECQGMRDQHSVIIGSSWGSLPTDQQKRWAQLLCDTELSPSVDSSTLPKVKGRFGLPIHYSSTPPSCSRYFNGTLHVIGISTTSNLFHVFADNILNHLATIVMDAYLYPELLHLPRKILIYPGFYVGNAPLNDHPVEHFKLLFQTFSGGKITLSEAEGMCFRRIIWGQGNNLYYVEWSLFNFAFTSLHTHHM